MPSCVAYGCTNKTNKQRKRGLSFFLFPKDRERRNEWIRAVSRANWQPSTSSALCSEHFTEDCINRTAVLSVRLRPHAIPSVFKAFPSYLQKEDKKLFQESKRRTRRSSKRKQIVQKEDRLLGSKRKRTTQPSKRKKLQKKNENPNHHKKARKILRPLEEQEKFEQELLASTTQVFPGSTSSSQSVIFPLSTTTNEIVGSTSKANHGAVLRIEALPVLNIKTEPEEEGEILGPQLSNFLDSSVEEEDIPKVKIKEEPPDDLPDIESFGLLEPIMEMTFQCEEPAKNIGTGHLDGCGMKVKKENCND